MQRCAVDPITAGEHANDGPDKATADLRGITTPDVIPYSGARLRPGE